MIAPRLVIDLDKIQHNAVTLVGRLAALGIDVTGVTKATLGSPDIARVLLGAGVIRIGDSRVENLEKMRRANIPAPMTLLRSPMFGQVERVVAAADTSLNTEIEIVAKLSQAARKVGRVHGVILMVELGDLREGIMPRDLEAAAAAVLRLPNIALEGIGTNLACQQGVIPDARNMTELSALADAIEAKCGITLAVVSGGNSGNLPWALGNSHVGRVNDLRLGESILLGREPLRRQPIEGLHTDAVILVAEVIESKVKPSRPRGETAQTAFGEQPAVVDRGPIHQAIFAIGRQDTDPLGLTPPAGMDVLGASSDHLIVDSATLLPVGTESTFQLNYSALLRAMTSPFVSRLIRHDNGGKVQPPPPLIASAPGAGTSLP